MTDSLLVTVQSDHNDHTYIAHQIAEFLAFRGYTNVNLLATHSIDEVETMMRAGGHPIDHPQRGDAMWLGHDRHIVVATDEPRNNNATRMVHQVPIRDLSPLWLPATPKHEFDDPDFGKEKPTADDLKVLQALINMTSLSAVMAFIKDAVGRGESLDTFIKHVQSSREAAKRSFFSAGEPELHGAVSIVNVGSAALASNITTTGNAGAITIIDDSDEMAEMEKIAASQGRGTFGGTMTIVDPVGIQTLNPFIVENGSGDRAVMFSNDVAPQVEIKIEAADPVGDSPDSADSADE